MKKNTTRQLTLITGCLLLVLFNQCKSGEHKKKQSNQNADTASTHFRHTIEVGKSGGFAGTSKYYKLNKSCLLLKTVSLENNNNSIPAGALSENDCNLLFDEIKKLNLPSLHIRQTGNVTYVIREQLGDSTYEVTWGVEQQNVPESIKSYYKLFMSKLPKE